jgi:hypothetical protein
MRNVCSSVPNSSVLHCTLLCCDDTHPGTHTNTQALGYMTSHSSKRQGQTHLFDLQKKCPDRVRSFIAVGQYLVEPNEKPAWTVLTPPQPFMSTAPRVCTRGCLANTLATPTPSTSLSRAAPSSSTSTATCSVRPTPLSSWFS